MRLIRYLGAVAAVGCLAVAAFAADFVWNDGRLFYLAMGRDAMVGACTPPARDALAGRGFTPEDFTIGDRPSIAFAAGTLGRARVLTAPFTFSDGPDGPRVDGRLVCAVHGPSVQVDVQVDATPLRAA